MKSSSCHNKNIFTADIGGTHSRFGLFHVGRDEDLELVDTLWLKTSEARSFRHLVDTVKTTAGFLKAEEADIVVIAIAGPVEAGVRSSPPLIPWDVDISRARQDFGFKKCALINDFVAQAFACRSLIGTGAEQILEGTPVPEAAVAIIGAGTGLGQAVLTPSEKSGYIALPSEGGHANFPFVSRREYEFQEFLLAEKGLAYIIGNDVVSGSGLTYIHKFLTGEMQEPEAIGRILSRHPETLEWAARFFGRACRNHALQSLSLGGLYIAGGVAARESRLVTDKAFELEFRLSDTMAGLLEKIPVFLIKDQNSGLWGSAVYGLQQLKEIGRIGGR